MIKDELERMNFLSEKLIRKEATSIELQKFNQLFNDWNITKELNIFN